VRHIQPFFDSSIWSGFDDSDGVRWFTPFSSWKLILLIEELLLYLPEPFFSPRIWWAGIFRPEPVRVSIIWIRKLELGTYFQGRAEWGCTEFLQLLAKFCYRKGLPMDCYVERERSARSARPTVRARDSTDNVYPDWPSGIWRRLMEKDNKKARDDARKEYNDTIRVSYSLFPLRFDHCAQALTCRLSLHSFGNETRATKHIMQHKISRRPNKRLYPQHQRQAR